MKNPVWVIDSDLIIHFVYKNGLIRECSNKEYYGHCTPKVGWLATQSIPLDQHLRELGDSLNWTQEIWYGFCVLIHTEHRAPLSLRIPVVTMYSLCKNVISCAWIKNIGSFKFPLMWLVQSVEINIIRILAVLIQTMFPPSLSHFGCCEASHGCYRAAQLHLFLQKRR